jgi:monoterpene epsilon-lactone hydrolase
VDLFERLYANAVLRNMVAARRALRGPKRASWTLQMELACEFMRLCRPFLKRMSVQQQRIATERLLHVSPLAQNTERQRTQVRNRRADWFTPQNLEHDAVLYYLHGGGYVLGSLETHQNIIAECCRAAGARAFAIDYRLAPEHPFPAAIEDAVSGYRYLLAQGIAAQRIVILGDSAGGGLTISTLLRLRTLDLPQPAAAVAISPWVNLVNASPLLDHHAPYDYVSRAFLERCTRAVLGDASPRNPLISSVYADLSGLPPLLIQAGAAEALLDDSILLAARARAAGVEVELDIHPDMVHVFHLFAAFAPESQHAFRIVGDFVRKRTGAHHTFSAVAEE